MTTGPFAAFILAAFMALASAALAEEPRAPAFETPFNLQASRILPPKLLSGPHHRVAETVANDGLMNTYTVRSRYGTYRVVSTALLAARVDEFKAMAAMDESGGAKEYGKGLVEGGENFVLGVKNLVTDPVNTFQNAASGVGKLFTRAEEGMTGSSASRYEDSAGAKLVGFASTRREQAVAYGVDPYSTNEQLREKLKTVAAPSYAGGVTTAGLKLLIPGGVGIAVSSVSGVNWLGQVDMAQPPADIRIHNRQALLDLGAGEASVWSFMDNAEYTPTQQSLIVKALTGMGRVGAVTTFLTVAARIENQDQALFTQRQALMYRGYHKRQDMVRGFVRLGAMAGALTYRGRLVLCLPLDHLCWTERVADVAAAVDLAGQKHRPSAVELWVAGTVSPTARKALEAKGWTVREKAGKELLGESLYL